MLCWGCFFSMRFSIWDMFTEIGTVTFYEDGLYYAYSASILSDRPNFIRLYCHIGEVTHRFGVFTKEGKVRNCSGRISVRSLAGDLQDAYFSIQEVPLRPLKTPLDGGYLPQKALYNPQKGRRFLSICHENSLPDGILPYFCFLRQECIDGTICLAFNIDSDGKPIIPE